ncbi:hypothetical protein LCGC14_2515970, partial [marine sediment metagenome]
ILIPVAYNDKTPVPFAKGAEYIYDIGELTGGVTIDGRVSGFYEAVDGTRQQDDLIKVWIVGEHTLLQPMRAIAKWIATDLEQESVYLEWHDVNVEFVKPSGE